MAIVATIASGTQPMNQMRSGAAAKLVSSRVKRRGVGRAVSLIAAVAPLLFERHLAGLDEHFGIVLVDAAVAALAPLEVEDRLVQVAAPEIGP